MYHPPLRHVVVALLAEGVDRNMQQLFAMQMQQQVALLAEGVDRNLRYPLNDQIAVVALLAEGVDRNRRTPPAPPLMWRRPPRGGRG